MQMIHIFILIFCWLFVVRCARIRPTQICRKNGLKCVDVYKCPYFVSLWRNPRKTKLEIIAEIRQNQCGFVNGNPSVCCPQPEQKLEKDNLGELGIKHKNLYLLPIDKCGNLYLGSRITFGKRTGLNEFPWMALIVHETVNPIENGLEFLCGGTLISEKYVLTAAHCIMETIIGVRLGEYDVVSVDDCNELNTYCAPPVQDFNIEQVVVHAEYNKEKDQNDIALIKLANPANMSYENVRPICLPLEGEPNLEGKLLTVAGWGFTETGHKSSILQKTSVPIIPLPVCKKIYEGQVELGNRQICAGGDKGDSCNGDSGGPLAMAAPFRGVPRYVQYGIVSYGPSACGSYGMPGIYTRVDSFIHWILDTLEP